MIIKTELLKLEIEIDGAVFICQEISTSELTEIAYTTKDDQAKSLKENFIKLVVGWKGLKLSNGKNLPYNNKNKEKLYEANHTMVERLFDLFGAQLIIETEGEKKS